LSAKKKPGVIAGLFQVRGTASQAYRMLSGYSTIRRSSSIELEP